ncbi:MAG: sulfite exporter TauE/SafE family protein [Elusimicrobia bacterium]|nr:sulfite exporter TauE/SafE family protein [Elusimicrobiota bacterium]
MSGILIAFGTALWLGILTSISPCPLATNVAAVSYLSKKILHIKAVLWSAVAYSLGRMVAYAVLGVIIISSLHSVPVIAQFLQRYMNKALGPILVIVGLFLLGFLRLNVSGFSISSEKQERLAQAGTKGAFALGFLFALAFCPTSAALFFGSLIPLALKSEIGIIFPILYGVGTALPVMIFAIGIALGISSVSRWFHKMSTLERYTKKITGIIFIVAGAYFIWAHIIMSIL